MTETTAQTVVPFEDVKASAGTDLGYTEWREVTQEMINTFADATDDQQWIHVDPERAKDGPFGAPIAHGFLTLSLIIPFWSELFDVTGVKTKVNYGLDKVRFTNPVKVGSRIRMKGSIADVQEVKGNGLHLVTDAVIEIEGEERPAVVATFLSRFYA
ncbi:MaoC family dehydratase [Citricoccus nitrophenolicus]|uniref:MaoC family dehydratase n=1 Tax=Citricoccus nitrophenolicus TaxID=863575 RepID=A0ABV0IGF0_9MICC|nr:MaoC family dehydratase [Citricoccus sp. I39-566]NUL45464.1 MaoC family dehydratase [Cellulosimicrobium funkei]WMY79183.1 MaoC family dehydratase [Citricoccus sp. I39-566]